MWFMAGIPSDSVRIVLFTVDNRFVLVCEADDPDNWKLPGGRVEDMEEPDRAAARELIEELGIDAEYVGLRLVRQVMNDDGIHARWIYKGTIDAPEILKPSAEISRAELFTRDRLPSTPNQQHILSAVDLAQSN